MKETIQLHEENQVLEWHSLLITLLCAMLLSRALPHNLGSPAGFPTQHPAPTSQGSNNQGSQIRAQLLRHQQQQHRLLRIMTATNFYSGGKKLTVQLTDCGEDTREAEVIHGVEREQVIQKLFPLLFTAQESVTLVKFPGGNKYIAFLLKEHFVS